ncbi:hypothetical protein MBSD_n2262 [Mizugakiibacter sediminis]|uniref:DUF2934 domain-containing protein n=1 Tax=Mizugakiibacter sediminis TaxID=1475481 RepID=A0A0K8QQF3_9GAMM|nr:hypothetical protein MBSD_n2262 [Mizugakiibacter sediminis]
MRRSSIGLHAPSGRRAAASSEPSDAASRADEMRVDAETRHAMIALAAYFRAERRGFAPGRELDDWLEAEREVAAMLDG